MTEIIEIIDTKIIVLIIGFLLMYILGTKKRIKNLIDVIENTIEESFINREIAALSTTTDKIKRELDKLKADLTEVKGTKAYLQQQIWDNKKEYKQQTMAPKKEECEEIIEEQNKKIKALEKEIKTLKKIPKSPTGPIRNI